MNFNKFFLTIASLILLQASAQAAVVSGTITSAAGSFSLIAPPAAPDPYVGDDDFNTNILYAFDEQQAVELATDLTLGSGQVFTAGTVLSSHYVFYDPLSKTRIVGSVDFDADILAVITGGTTLNNTDTLFGATGTIYRTPGLRGLENDDSVSFLGRTLSVDFTASTPGDYVRVLTAVTAVPVPAAVWLFGSGLLGLLGLQKRRKATTD